jgi:hypothetical protein
MEEQMAAALAARQEQERTHKAQAEAQLARKTTSEAAALARERFLARKAAL